MKTPFWRAALPIVGLLGLLAVVAVAAAGHSPVGGTSRPTASTPKLLQDYLATIFLIMMPLGAYLIFWAAVLRRAYANVPLKKSQLFPGQIVPKPVVTVLLVFVALFIAVRWARPTHNLLPGGAAAASKSRTQKAQAGHQPYEPHFQWLPVFVVGSLIV